MDRIVSFDKNYLIRVLDDEKFEEAKKLKEQCQDFLESKYPEANKGDWILMISLHSNRNYSIQWNTEFVCGNG